MSVFIRSNSAFTNPLPDTPVLPPMPITSDTFNRSNADRLTRTDAGLGGAPVSWLGNTEVFGVRGNQAEVLPHTGVFFVGVAVPVPDYELALRVTAFPRTETAYLDARRPLVATMPTQDGIRLSFNNNSVRLSKRVSSLTTVLGDLHTFALGDTVAVRVKGTTAQLRINGKVMEEHTVTDASLQSGGHAGLSGSAGLTALTFDDFTVTPI